MHKQVHIIVLGILWVLPLSARVPIVHPNLGEPTGIAPAYFGPNAFPVPEMLDGRTQSYLRLEIAGDDYFGYEEDKTVDLFARAYIPLFTERVNLTLWMPVQEWYSMTIERQHTCRLQDSIPMAGHIKGFEPFAEYQYGIKDYPFHQVRVGLAYGLKILKK